MTSEQQEMLLAAHAARASGFKRVEIAPDDLIELLDRIAALERDKDTADKVRERDTERIKQLMRQLDEAESAWQDATWCETADDARCRVASLEREVAELRAHAPNVRDDHVDRDP
jgi:hypothetical protein